MALSTSLGQIVSPTILRAILFLGLVFHKILWEALKRRAQRSAQHAQQQPGAQAGGPLKRLLKTAKGLALVFIVVQTLFLEVFPIAEDPSWLSVIGTALYAVGLATAVIGRVQLGGNWANLEDYQVLPGQSLVMRGLYRYIRHPIYAGDVLLLLGLELALNSWLALGIPLLLLVVIRQASEEEALLSRALPDYDAYRARTKRFIPFVL